MNKWNIGIFVVSFESITNLRDGTFVQTMNELHLFLYYKQILYTEDDVIDVAYQGFRQSVRFIVIYRKIQGL